MADSPLRNISSNKVFGGELTKYSFKSTALGGLDATFNLYLPPNAAPGTKVPLLIYLAGLTCSEDTGAQKAGFFSHASGQDIAFLFPDTSPRGAGAPGENDSWDFGTGAGFYLNATKPEFSQHYNMFTHITEELPRVIEEAGLPIDLNRQSIFGHSMGGHGSLTLYLRTQKYRSASAFAPITNPSQSPWGQKAFRGYLQDGVEEGNRDCDATELIARHRDPVHILIDYGTADKFYQAGELLPENFSRASREAGYDDGQVRVRRQEGYDHSYYFVSTFTADHIQFHAQFLKPSDK